MLITSFQTHQKCYTVSVLKATQSYNQDFLLFAVIFANVWIIWQYVAEYLCFWVTPSCKTCGYLLKFKSQVILLGWKFLLLKTDKNPQLHQSKQKKKPPPKQKQNKKHHPQIQKTLSFSILLLQILQPTFKFHSLVSYTIYSFSFPPQRTKATRANLNSLQFHISRGSQYLNSGSEPAHPGCRGAQEVSVQTPVHSRRSHEPRLACSGLYPGKSWKPLKDRLHNPSGQPDPPFGCPQSKKVSPYAQPEPLISTSAQSPSSFCHVPWRTAQLCHPANCVAPHCRC